MASQKFLVSLTEALVYTSAADPPKTQDFATVMERVLPVFDHLGTVLTFAKTDMAQKTVSIRQATQFETLADLVSEDKQNGTVTTKNSLARNLHRLRTVIVFTDQIMSKLMEDAAMTLSAAVSAAYAETLAQYHSVIIRGTCNAGFLLLPSRQAFLSSIGETEESAMVSTQALLPAAQAVIRSIDKLYDGPMPASSAWF